MVYSVGYVLYKGNISGLPTELKDSVRFSDCQF